jgi:myo-inositol-1-phosphate synthase
MQVEGAYTAETLNLVEYVENKEDPLIQIVRKHQHNTNSALLQTANKFKKSFPSETKKIKNMITQNIKGKWEEKGMHGQFPRSLDDKLVDKEQSYQRLKVRDIKGETESTVVAAQDQAISTNYFKIKILKEKIESRCRLSKEHEETIDHLTSGCPILAKNEYVVRHDRVCTLLHYSICKTLGIETTENCFLNFALSPSSPY